MEGIAWFEFTGSWHKRIPDWIFWNRIADHSQAVKWLFRSSPSLSAWRWTHHATEEPPAPPQLRTWTWTLRTPPPRELIGEIR